MQSYQLHCLLRLLLPTNIFSFGTIEQQVSHCCLLQIPIIATTYSLSHCPSLILDFPPILTLYSGSFFSSCCRSYSFPRIAVALATPSAYSLEMNSILSHLLAKTQYPHHNIMAPVAPEKEMPKTENVKQEKVEKREMPFERKSLLLFKLMMYEI